MHRCYVVEVSVKAIRLFVSSLACGQQGRVPWPQQWKKAWVSSGSSTPEKCWAKTGRSAQEMVEWLRCRPHLGGPVRWGAAEVGPAVHLLLITVDAISILGACERAHPSLLAGLCKLVPGCSVIQGPWGFTWPWVMALPRLQVSLCVSLEAWGVERISHS